MMMVSWLKLKKSCEEGWFYNMVILPHPLPPLRTRRGGNCISSIELPSPHAERVPERSEGGWGLFDRVAKWQSKKYLMIINNFSKKYCVRGWIPGLLSKSTCGTLFLHESWKDFSNIAPYFNAGWKVKIIIVIFLWIIQVSDMTINKIYWNEGDAPKNNIHIEKQFAGYFITNLYKYWRIMNDITREFFIII